MAKTKEIFNAASQQVETASLEVDNNGDIVATFEDGNFVKFPSVDAKEFEALAADVQDNNEGQESAAAVDAAKEQSNAVIDEVATGEVDEAPAESAK